MKKLLNKFLLGCDPEFVLLKGQNIVHIRPRPTPLDGIGDVGEDHGGNVWELHPIQTRGAYALVKRMHALFPTIKQWGEAGVKFKAGAYVEHNQRKETLGGHVHFGMTVRDMCGPQGGNAPFVKWLKNLDRFTLSLEALDLLPTKESENRRQYAMAQGQKYGSPSDYRESGNDRHIEYRSMASWLTSPELAFLCLTGAKLIAVDPNGDVPLPGTISMKKLKEFFERYKEDTNALRCIDKVFDQLPKTDPTADIKEAWNKPISF